MKYNSPLGLNLTLHWDNLLKLKLEESNNDNYAST